MANNTIQIKRTSVTGRAANTTTLTNPGELALNMTDGIMYSTNGSSVFEIGANLSSIAVGNSTSRFVANTTRVSISTSQGLLANGSIGTAGQFLTSNGTTVYWSTPSTGVNAQQTIYTYTLGANTTVIQGADDSAATLNYTAGLESVFINGVRQIGGGVDYNTTNATAITLTANAIAGEVVQVVTWVGAVNSTNAAAQYTWTNTHTFSNTVTFSGAISANGSVGTAGQVLHSNGTAVYWAADDNAGGTVTSIATANGLSGGPITTTGTLGVTTGSTLTVNTTGIHVNSDLSITSLTLNSNLFINGGGDLVISSAGVGGANANTSFYNDASDLYINVNNAIRAYVASNGNFGVGNTTPTDKFRVEGNISYSGNLIAQAVSANGSVGTNGQILTSNGSTTYWQTQQLRTDGQVVISANTTLDASHLGGNILVTTAGITITLPASGFDSGTTALISNISGDVINLAYAYAGDGPTKLYAGDSVMLVTDGNGSSLYWRQYSYTNILGVSVVTAVSASSINCALGTYFTKTATGALTWTTTNIPASGAFAFILELTNGGTGTQTWMSGTKWPGGTAPTLVSSGVDVLGFITDDGGTTWRGVQIMADSK